MNLHSLAALLAQAAPASGQPPSIGDALRGPFVPMMLMMGAILFIMHRNGKKREQQLKALLAKLKTGDRVVTSAGVLGIVTSVKDKTVTIRSAESKLEVLKSAVTEITEIATES